MLNENNAIAIKNLAKSFKNLRVLEGIDLSVKKGTMLALLGPNGAGKTTIVRILSTLLKPDAGEVLVNGFNVEREPGKVRRVIGLTGQYTAVDELLNGRENLIMIGRLYHLSKEESKARTEELLGRVDLAEAAGRQVKTYSGGMRRRLDLAASLIARPPVIFLDEPTSGLDPRSRLSMWSIIEKLVEEGTTILLTTQYLEEADRLADRIAVLDKGKIIAEGTASQLKASVGTERVEVVIERAEDFDRAIEVLKRDGMKSDKEERIINVSTNGSVFAVKQILDALNDAKIEIDAMSVHKPTLDDVFLRLTGHEANDGKNPDEA